MTLTRVLMAIIVPLLFWFYVDVFLVSPNLKLVFLIGLSAGVGSAIIGLLSYEKKKDIYEQSESALDDDPLSDLPDPWIIEGTNSFQCACPQCDYGEGYLEPVLASSYEIKALKCPKCGLRFKGIA